MIICAGMFGTFSYILAIRDRVNDFVDETATTTSDSIDWIRFGPRDGWEGLPIPHSISSIRKQAIHYLIE